jgi:GTPase SAR1 family protein
MIHRDCWPSISHNKTRKCAASSPVCFAGILCNAVVVGDCAVGKSSLIRQYVDDCFSPQHISTIGIDLLTKVIERPNLEVKVAMFVIED